MGFSQELIDQHGITLEEAISNVRACLHPAAVLVGQNILKDMHWLGLDQGKDYSSLIDLSAVFRVWNSQRNQWTNFSQDHVASVRAPTAPPALCTRLRDQLSSKIMPDEQCTMPMQGCPLCSCVRAYSLPNCVAWRGLVQVWLGIGERPTHDALNDASISMALFNACVYAYHRLL